MEGNFESEDSSLGPGSVSGIPSTSSMNNFSPSEPEMNLMDDVHSDASMDHRITPAPPAIIKQEPNPEPNRPQVARQLVFTDNSQTGTPNRGMVIKESALNEVIAQASKLGNNAAVLMPGNYLLPVNLLKSGRQIAILTSANGSKILAALPGTSSDTKGSAQLLSPVKQEQLTVQDIKRLATEQINKSVAAGNSAGKTEGQQVFCLRTVSNNATQLILSPNSNAENKLSNPVFFQRNDSSTSSQTETPHMNTSTAIIISSPKGKKRYLVNDPEILMKLSKSGGSDLTGIDLKKLIEIQETPLSTTTTTSNTINSNLESGGSSQQNKPHQVFVITNSAGTLDGERDLNLPEGAKVLHMHKHITSNGGVELEIDRDREPNVIQHHNTAKIVFSDRRIADLSHRNLHHQQAALERELRLQKSLSEECEDLGVDEPENLFPEADLLFDNLDPSSQENPMVDTPKTDKLTPIFFSDELRRKRTSSNSPLILKPDSKSGILKLGESEIKIETNDSLSNFGQMYNEDSNLGASTEVKTHQEDEKPKDLYEFNVDEKSSDENTDTEYNRFLHKKLGRLNKQQPLFSYKRKRSIPTQNPIHYVSPSTNKKSKIADSDHESPNSDNDDMITIIDHHSNAGSTDIEDCIETSVVQNVGDTLVISTENKLSDSPHTRRSSTRGHVKKNCRCCQPKKGGINHEHLSPIKKSPSPVMTRKLRASIGSPSESSTYSSSSPSTSNSITLNNPQENGKRERTSRIITSSPQTRQASKLSKRR